MMAAEKYAFVVLHYGGVEVTYECVDLLKSRFCAENVFIVVVDNASPDFSGASLKEKYADDPSVAVLLNPENLGFARGNNVGYRYAKETLGCQWICVMNNDVFIEQPDFWDRVQEEFRESQFGVLGPHVMLPGEKENHPSFELKSIEFYRQEYERINKLYRYYSSALFPIRNRINRMLDVLLQGKKKENSVPPKPVDESIFQKKHENVVLHGCCIVCSPLYVETFDDAFCPDTFMFREEELLFLRCKKHGLKTVYQPSVRVLHLEDVSTNASHKKMREKEIFICGNQVKSLKILISAMEK